MRIDPPLPELGVSGSLIVGSPSGPTILLPGNQLRILQVQPDGSLAWVEPSSLSGWVSQSYVDSQDVAVMAYSDSANATLQSYLEGLVNTHAGLTAAHGATGAVVGTTNTQTLTNKTLTTPTISGTGFTNAQHAHTGASSGGQISHASLTNLNTDTAPTSIHHTLDTGANQAAAGNHTHAQLHDAMTATDSTHIDFTVTGQDLTGVIKTNSITATQIAPNTITHNEIGTGAVRTDEIAAGVIEPAHFNAGLMYGGSGAAGTISRSDHNHDGTYARIVASGAWTLNFGSIGAGATAALVLAVPGVLTTDVVVINQPSTLPAGIIHSGSRSGSGDIALWFTNISGGAIDPPEFTFRYMVLRAT